MYFLDLGFRNRLARDFRNRDPCPDVGPLMENFVASELTKKGYELRFWRTKSGAEVDFVLETRDSPLSLEVKAGTTEVPGKSLRSFIKKYRPKEAYVFHTGNVHTMKVEETEVSFLPLYALPLLDW